MATTILYPGLTGAQSDFAIPFEYLSVAHVHVTLEGAPVPFTFSSKYLIHVTTPPVGTLKIARITPASQTINDYTDGSILAGNDLDNSFYQNLFVNEELKDEVTVIHTELTDRLDDLQLDADSKAPLVHTHDASSVTTGQFPDARIASIDGSKITGIIDPARLPVIPGTTQELSSGDLTNLTAGQKANISRGAVVTTTDGKRWLYTGTGDKALEASYILLADTTPEWNAVANKPNFDTLYLGKTGGTLTGDATINKSGDAALRVQSSDANPLLELKRPTGTFEVKNNASNQMAVNWYDAAGVYQRTPFMVKNDGQVRVDGGDLMLTGLAGTVRSFKLASSGVSRFKIGLGSGPEGGGNAGSTFVIWRCDDAGNDIDTPFLIDRATGIPIMRGSEVTLKNAASSTAQQITRVVAESGTGSAILSLDPGNNGYNVRDFSIRASNNGGNQITASFYVSNAATPAKAFDILPSAVTNFTNRPTWNGVGLATQAEAAAGGGGAGVSSFAGRTGAVAATAGDYDSAKITHGGGTVNDTLTTLSNRTQLVFTPEQYGAVGDGTADDIGAFNSMMAAIPDNGPSLVLLSKRYYLSAQWQINKSGIRISGRGGMDYLSSRGTAIIFKNNAFDGIMVGTNVDGTMVYGIEMDHFQVVMQTCTDSTRFIAVVAGAAHVRMTRVRMLGSSNNSANQCNGLWFRDGQSLNLDQVYMVGVTAEYCFLQSAALQINNPGGDQRWIYGNRRPDVVVAYACRFAAEDGNTRTQAVRLGGTASASFGSSMFRDCTTVFCKNHYVAEKELGDTTQGLPSFFYVMGKGGEGASGDYIRLVHGYHFMMGSVYLGTADDSGSGGSGLVVEATFGGPVTANGNYIKSTAKHVVHLKGSQDITLTGNTFGRAGVGSSQVYSNVRIESGTKEVIISGNNLTNLVPGTAEPYSATRYGLDSASNDNIVINGNRCRGSLGDIRYPTGGTMAVSGNLGAVTTF
ncbi:phage tail fiber protein [Pararhizobium sp. A13]|uniref:phage tail fiber domain-containing protein n=1 Tax=Pararhizobium sp. A13 TaxID=3133975 RepID=UPI00324BC5B0